MLECFDIFYWSHLPNWNTWFMIKFGMFYNYSFSFTFLQVNDQMHKHSVECSKWNHWAINLYSWTPIFWSSTDNPRHSILVCSSFLSMFSIRVLSTEMLWLSHSHWRKRRFLHYSKLWLNILAECEDFVDGVGIQYQSKKGYFRMKAQLKCRSSPNSSGIESSIFKFTHKLELTLNSRFHH